MLILLGITAIVAISIIIMCIISKNMFEKFKEEERLYYEAYLRSKNVSKR